jgi:hypothetical protein
VLQLSEASAWPRFQLPATSAVAQPALAVPQLLLVALYPAYPPKCYPCRYLLQALDAAKGMLYLHSHSPPLLHRDLKSPNLLVTRSWHVKVGAA